MPKFYISSTVRANIYYSDSFKRIFYSDMNYEPNANEPRCMLPRVSSFTSTMQVLYFSHLIQKVNLIPETDGIGPPSIL